MLKNKRSKNIILISSSIMFLIHNYVIVLLFYTRINILLHWFIFKHLYNDFFYQFVFYLFFCICIFVFLHFVLSIKWGILICWRNVEKQMSKNVGEGKAIQSAFNFKVIWRFTTTNNICLQWRAYNSLHYIL